MKEKIELLRQFVSPNRWELFQKVINYRTRYITVVLEDIYQPHNASAVLRSCDIFGIQDVHIIENRNEYRVNPQVSMGSQKWLTLYKYNELENNTLSAIKALKSKGYRIVATTPHRDDVELKEFDLSKGPVALMFGSELPGLSEIALNNADEFLKIDMYGFTESFNISVSAAITLHYLVNKLHQSDISWQLSQEERDEILFTWLKKSVRASEQILKRFENEKQTN